MLEAYVADHPELCIVDEFVDDGYSGSNFERPAFQNLFRELEQGTINCVLVKDFDWRLLPASLESATDSSGWPLGDAAQGVPETAKTSLLSEPAAEWKAGRCFGRRGRTGSRAI